jgi:hypothetical protein
VLKTYPEIRDRIYHLARQHGLRVDWIDYGRLGRELLLYDSRQMVLARTRVPVRNINLPKCARLENDLAGVFGEGWMN